MSVVELGRLPGFRVGAVGPLLVTVFEETATLERLALLERIQDDFVVTHRAMYALNVVVGRSVKSPDAEVRDVSARLQEKFNQATVASATVLTVHGLGAVIARGFMAALALLARGSTPTEVFKTVPEAARWLQTLPGVPAELAEHAELADEVDAFVADAHHHQPGVRLS